MFTKTIEKLKRWFNRSWTIFQARFMMVAGIVVAGFGAVDWVSLLAGAQTTPTNYKAFLIMGAVMFVKGILEEVGRRQNTKVIEETGQLIPANVEKVKLEGETKVKEV